MLVCVCLCNDGGGCDGDGVFALRGGVQKAIVMVLCVNGGEACTHHHCLEL